MRILHYSLGFPPYRTGGLTKFCIDLMIQQIRDGHLVALMWPGRVRLFSDKIKYVESEYKTLDVKIKSFEIINPIYVPYDEGINRVDIFMKYGDKKVYEDLLDMYAPDIIHIHTLMGLHKAFLEVAREKKIKIIFSSHDFFPICPKVTLFHNGDVCHDGKDCKSCVVCNKTALNEKKLILLQSGMYRGLKNSKIIRKLRKKHRTDFFENVNENAMKSCNSDMVMRYKSLRNYYLEMLELVDMIHYNSSVTKDVYEKYGIIKNNKIIAISHLDIADHKRKKDFSDFVRIGYLGPNNEAKGFKLLMSVLDTLWEERQDFCLNLYFEPKEKSQYMCIHERYSYDELKMVFDGMDVLVVPSIGYETFGYTVVEALSYGVPVIITEHVGAKDILIDGAGIVTEATAESLLKAIKSVDIDSLDRMNKRIFTNQKIVLMKSVATQIENECYKT